MNYQKDKNLFYAILKNNIIFEYLFNNKIIVLNSEIKIIENESSNLIELNRIINQKMI